MVQYAISNHGKYMCMQGTVWPGMETEVIVTFQPNHAEDYKVTAFLDIEGRADRLSLQLTGKGIGPQAVFSYDTLDVGDAYINTPHKYEVELMNR